MFGLLNIAKPAGPTSHDIVAVCRRLLPRGVKVGHAGTLDPFASGVLVVCIGPATRLADDVADAPKQYLAEVTFGATSTTDDTEGEITPTKSPLPDRAAIQNILPQFVGDIMQVPPAHSAVHVDGKRAYKLARRGEKVDLPPRKVQVMGVELVEMAGVKAILRIDCGKGFYIRALVRDIGAAVGCGAYCSALTRTRIGQFTLENAIRPEELSRQNIGQRILPATVALANWPLVTATSEQVSKIYLGQTIDAPADFAADRAALVDETGRLIACCDFVAHHRRLAPKRVFPL